MRSLDYEIYKILTKIGLVSSKVLVLMDGGVCSQMHQYLLGQCFADRGFPVYYDLSFFEEWGSDLNNQFVRNFDLLKAFPYLSLKEASRTMIRLYKRKYYCLGNKSEGNLKMDDFSFLQRSAPVYLGGYYQLPSALWLEKFHRLFKCDPRVLDEQSLRLYHEIDNTPCSVAVHIRRGDLKEAAFTYGKPATTDYFRKAIRFFLDKMQHPFFYLFSDEPDWVAGELVAELPLSDHYKVVDANGSDKGYMDLFLIAACKHQITTKGTMGKYGALLGDYPDKCVVLCDDETEYPWREYFKNPFFL